MCQTNNPARNRMDDRTLFFVMPLIVAVFVLAIGDSATTTSGMTAQ